MNDETQAAPASEEQTDETQTEETTEETTEQVEETPEQLRARLAKAEEIAENQRKRAEKAERAAKEAKPPAEAGSLSTNDLYALVNEKVPQEDIDRVVSFAKSEGMTVQEALRNDELKAILSIRAEKRATAQATATGNARRQTGKVSDDALLAKAQKGEMPESEEDMRRLIMARQAQRRGTQQ